MFYFWGSPGVPCIPLYAILLYARKGLSPGRLPHVKGAGALVCDRSLEAAQITARSVSEHRPDS